MTAATLADSARTIYNNLMKDVRQNSAGRLWSRQAFTSHLTGQRSKSAVQDQLSIKAEPELRCATDRFVQSELTTSVAPALRIHILAVRYCFASVGRPIK